jgi:hypothetical protein
MSRRFETGCTIEVEHSDENLCAHVSLDGDPLIGPGDAVKVHGDPIHVAFGERRTFRRTATVTRATWLERTLTRLTSGLEFGELYDVSFTPGRIL